MSNNDFFNLMALLGTMNPYSDFELDDIDYMNNEPVQDLLFDYYLGMLQLDIMDPKPDNYEERIDMFANNIKERLLKLKPDEQAYVEKQIRKTLHLDEKQDEKTLEKRKEND